MYLLPILGLATSQALALDFDRDIYDRSAEGIEAAFSGHMAAVNELEKNGHIVVYLGARNEDEGVLWQLDVTQISSEEANDLEGHRPGVYGMDELNTLLQKEVGLVDKEDEVGTLISFDYVPEAPTSAEDPFGFFQMDLKVAERWELAANPIATTVAGGVFAVAFYVITENQDEIRDGFRSAVYMAGEVWDELDGSGSPQEPEPEFDDNVLVVTPPSEPADYEDPDDAGVVGCIGAECDMAGLGSTVERLDPLETLIYTLHETGEVPLVVMEFAEDVDFAAEPGDVDFLETRYAALMTIEQLLGIQPIDVLVNPGTGDEALGQ